MLKRLQKKKSSMDVMKWEVERRQQEKLLDKLCYHPHIFKVDYKDELMKPSIIQPPMALNNQEYMMNTIEETKS